MLNCDCLWAKPWGGCRNKKGHMQLLFDCRSLILLGTKVLQLRPCNVNVSWFKYIVWYNYTGLDKHFNSYIRRHLGSFWFHLGPEDPRLKQVSRLFPDRLKPLLQMYWIVEPTVKCGPDSTRLLCSTFPGSAQDTTGLTDEDRLLLCCDPFKIILTLVRTQMTTDPALE